MSLASGQAQDFGKPILDKAKQSLQEGDFTKAIEALQAAETCDFKNTLLSKRQQLLNETFDAIQRQKEVVLQIISPSCHWSQQF